MIRLASQAPLVSELALGAGDGLAGFVGATSEPALARPADQAPLARMKQARAWPFRSMAVASRLGLPADLAPAPTSRPPSFSA